MTGLRCRAAIQAALCALALVACKPDDEPATQLIVSINSDLAIASEISRVRIEIHETGGNGQSAPRTFNLTTGAASGGRVRFPFSFGVQKGSAERVTVIATGFGPTGSGSEGPVVERKANARFREGKALLLKLFLSAACRGNVACGPSQTCQLDAPGDATPGQCGAIREPSDLDPIEPGDEDDAWDEGASGDGGSSGASGEGGTSGQAGSGGAGTGGEAGDPGDCNPPCGAGEECIDLTCYCTDGTQPFYADTDSDGYGDASNALDVCGGVAPDGYVDNSSDCCDSDDAVHPEAMVSRFVPSACGDGSGGNADWDINCDGTIEGFVTVAGGNCCDDIGGWTDGWMGSAPFCGELGIVQRCDTSTCEVEEIEALQECL